MKEKLLIALVLTLVKNIIKACLDGETQRKFVDAVLDAAEEFVKRTDNKLDDEIIVPLINSIRQNFNVPQNE